MTYFVFDLDETLAEMFPMFYFIASLKLQETIQEDDQDFANFIPEKLTQSLNKAYTIFIDKILKEETSQNPLGILRPGILSIMKELHSLQLKGKVTNVVIFSNNGHLQSLEFIRDIIHKYLQTDNLIKECIHLNHPMRYEQNEVIVNKTWPILKNIMIHGNCKAQSTLEPKDIFFFDDLDHTDLRAVLGKNYIQVPPYTFMASHNRIAELFIDSMNEANVNEPIFTYYMSYYFPNKKIEDSPLEEVVSLFKAKNSKLSYDRDKPDYGIELMRKAILTQSGGNKKRRLNRTRRKRNQKQKNTQKKN
jgi:hypothetical protein